MFFAMIHQKRNMLLSTIILSIAICSSGCHPGSEVFDSTKYEILGAGTRIRDDTWQEYGGGTATYDGQFFTSLQGDSYSHEIKISFAVNAEKLKEWVIFSLTGEYAFAKSEIKVSGVSQSINNGESIKFYYAKQYRRVPVKEKATGKTGSVDIAEPPAYACVIQASDGRKRVDTREDLAGWDVLQTLQPNIGGNPTASITDDSDYGWVRVTAPVSAYVRSSPSKSGKDLYSVKKNDLLVYEGDSEYDERPVLWHKVSSVKGTGWISSKYSKLE